MARITKEPMVRMNEILNAAESLFYSKGYDETAVSDIVKAVGIAQGTFYNYFSSKEAVLAAAVIRQLKKIYHKIEGIIDSDETPSHKLELMVYLTFNNLRKGNGWMFDFLYNNAHLHIVDSFVRQASILFGPLAKKIIEEGNRLGCFNVSHPDEALEFIHSILACICHSLYQKLPDEQVAWRLEIAGKMIGAALGLEGNVLHFTI